MPEEWEPEVGATTLQADTDADSEPKSDVPTVRCPSRRARAALRRQRKLYNQLLTRFDDLERKIEQSLTESSSSDGEPVEAANTPVDTSTAVEQERRHQELESQLAQVRENLTTRDRELHQARYSIDVLERQLIDSQRTMHDFAEERLTWESQFNELEARLADYVERIQELEHQLEGVRVRPADSLQAAIAPSIDWAAEPATEESTSVDEVVTETDCDSSEEVVPVSDCGVCGHAGSMPHNATSATAATFHLMNIVLCALARFELNSCVLRRSAGLDRVIHRLLPSQVPTPKDS